MMLTLLHVLMFTNYHLQFDTIHCFQGDDHGPDDNEDGAVAKDVAPPNGENVKKKARQ